MVSFQPSNPVEVYNGPDLRYKVNAAYDANGNATQLFGIDDRWLDAFSRLRVSEPVTLFEVSFTYDLQELLCELVETTGGTVTHEANACSAVLEVTGTSGSIAAIQSRQYHPYEKGRSQLIKTTFELGDAVANVRRRVGYFSEANGFYLEQTTAGVSFVRRSSSTGSLVNTSVARADWNLDQLDGTGPSGFTLDESKAQILVIDGQWLGVGRVRMGLDIDGLVVWCHQWLHANTHDTAPYVQSFSLPVRWEVESTAASAGATFKAICADVESEGGTPNPNGLQFAAYNSADVATSTTRAAVLAIRPAANYPAAGPVNRQVIIPGEFSAFVASTSCLIELFYAPTLTGGTWTRANDSSGVEYGTGQTITDTGVLMSAGFVTAANKVSSAAGRDIASQYPLTLSIAGDSPRVLLIAATAITGTGTCRASAEWTEVR